MVGARADLSLESDAWASAMVHGGRAATAGDAWISALAGAGIQRRAGPIVIGAGVHGFVLDYVEPFLYIASGLTLRPSVGAVFGRTRITLEGDWRAGRWRTEYEVAGGGPGGPPGQGGPPTSNRTVVADGPLSVTGGALRIRRAIGPGRLDVTAERLSAKNGAVTGVYQGAGAAYAFEIGCATARIAARVWQSPDLTDRLFRDTEFGFRLGLDVPVGASGVAHADVGRTVADPLYGTAGAIATSMGMSWRFRVADATGRPPVVAVGAASGDGRRVVRFRVRAPRARSVALAGDFSEWEPLRMRRADDGAWVLEIPLPPGLHHFAFRIDRERWYVPDDAPGIVDDGWGRRNASVVVEAE